MNARDHADVIEGPEPPVAELSEIEPAEPVPPHLDRIVLDDIRGRLRAEAGGGRQGRMVLVAAISAVTAAAAAVALTLIIGPQLGRDQAMVPKGAGPDGAEVYLDYLVQHGETDVPHRQAVGEDVLIGDGIYLRADLNQPGALTFLVEEPQGAWTPLATIDGQPGANDLQRDGKLKVFYVTEAGPYRFAALWSDEHPPGDWEPGDGDEPDSANLGDGVEVAWVEIETRHARP